MGVPVSVLVLVSFEGVAWASPMREGRMTSPRGVTTWRGRDSINVRSFSPACRDHRPGLLQTWLWALKSPMIRELYALWIYIIGAEVSLVSMVTEVVKASRYIGCHAIPFRM